MTIKSINEPDPPSPDPAKKDPAEASQGVTKKEGDISRETSDELPSDAELERMTRAELDALAESRGVDISTAHNKDAVVAALRKDARKRK